ncbi:MAG: hypothetical protein ACI84C_002849 [Flavobacteriales bacterium]|jgi:hypothetical protein
MVELSRNTSIARYQLVDGILVCRLKNELIIDERLAMRIAAEFAEMELDELIPFLLVVPENRLLLEPEAFRYLASQAGSNGTCAIAVVLESSLRALLINVSSFLVRSEVPLRIFKSRGEARLWLFNYILDKEEIY